MQPFCWGPLRVRWAERMLQADFLRPDAMPIRLELTLFSLMGVPDRDGIGELRAAILPKAGFPGGIL